MVAVVVSASISLGGVRSAPSASFLFCPMFQNPDWLSIHPARQPRTKAPSARIVSFAEDPNGPWLSGAASQPCSHTCQKEGFANCGKEEMAAINSSAALFTLTSHLNLTCDPPTGTPYRDGGGSPFTTTGGSCYYWDPSKPADEVNCDTVLNSGRQPLCYCVPDAWLQIARLAALCGIRGN